MIVTAAPLLRHPELGLVVPPVPEVTVSWYCCWKFAVIVVAEAGAVTECV